jgi:hypothetical protein
MGISNSGYQKGTTADPSTSRRVLAQVGPQIVGASALPATLVVGTGTGSVIFQTKATGPGSNGTASVAVVASGNNTALSVTTSGGVVTVHLATDGSGNPTSTAAQVRDAIAADGTASALIRADLARGSDGSGVVSAAAQQALLGGAAMTSGPRGGAPLPTQPPIHNSYR